MKLKYIIIFPIFTFFSCLIKKEKNDFEIIEKYLNQYVQLNIKAFPKFTNQNVIIEKLDSANFVIFKAYSLSYNTFTKNKLEKYIYLDTLNVLNNFYFISFDKNIRKNINFRKFRPKIEGDFYIPGLKIKISNKDTIVNYINYWPEIKWAAVIPKK